MGIIDAFDQLLQTVMSSMKMHINDYCELETTEGEYNLVTKDGSMATIIRYEGFRNLISANEFDNFSSDLAYRIQPFLNKRGHQVQVVYVREIDPTSELNTILQPSYDTCKELRMDLSDLLDDARETLARVCLYEAVFIVLWSRPTMLDPAERALEKQERKEYQTKYKVPAMMDGQNLMRPIRFLVDQHNAFVDTFLDVVFQLRGSAQKISAHDAVREQKRFLYRDFVPDNWKPQLPGDRMLIRWKRNSNNDISVAVPARLDQQIMMSDGAIGNSKGDGGVTDTRAVRIGNKIFAPCMISIHPQRIMPFTTLFSTLHNATTKTIHGNKPMPWAISFNLEGDGIAQIQLKKVFAGILGPTSEINRNFVAASNALSHYRRQGGCVVKFQVNACTWAEMGDEKQLMIRRSKLIKALSSWGDTTVLEETGDPLEGVTSCVPGLMPRSIAPAAAAPIEDASFMLPLQRPASPFFGGQSAYRTLDGKLMKWEMFSAQQTAWITLIFATMGAGKSVWLNRQNIELCLVGGLKKLPFICAIDIGISSQGFINAIQDGLPEEQKHLAIYKRIQNTKEYAINQLDTKLGCRYPLQHERETMKNWLVALATSADGRTHRFMPEFCGRVIDAAFCRFSDDDEQATPKEYGHEADLVVKQAVDAEGIPFSQATKWWEIVDALFEAGRLFEAERAQRYAVPTLMDLMGIASEPSISADFANALDEGMKVEEVFKIMVSAAIGDYPIFSTCTQFDVGAARIMALDLQDVVQVGSEPARKAAALFFAMARSAFIRKINLSPEDLPYVNKKYRPYFERLVLENTDTYKRICYDEYHKTGGNKSFREIILTDGREGRKWNLEIMLSSQLPDDFDKLAEIATCKVILSAGTPQTRARIKEIFGLSETEEQALLQYVHGPTPDGATFLAKIQVKSGEMTQLFTSTIGPIMYWSLTTTAEDRAVRSLLYQRMPKAHARKMLAKHFPRGGCKAYVMRLRNKASTGDVITIEEGHDLLITERIADEIEAEYRQLVANNEFR